MSVLHFALFRAWMPYPNEEEGARLPSGSCILSQGQVPKAVSHRKKRTEIDCMWQLNYWTGSFWFSSLLLYLLWRKMFWPSSSRNPQRNKSLTKAECVILHWRWRLCKRIYFAKATFSYLLLGKKLEHSYFGGCNNWEGTRLQHSGVKDCGARSVSSLTLVPLHVKLLERE